MSIPKAIEMRKFLAPEFVIGDGSIGLLANYSQNFGGEKALLVTDEGVTNAGWTRYVESVLRHKDIDYEIFNQITPNPKDFEIAAGYEIYKKYKCDFIIAVGGGSVMDCAKGIGILCTNTGNIQDFEGVDKIQNPLPPLICIPTTAGTAADISQFAIIDDTNRKLKFAIISKSLVPDISLIDPITTTTKSPELTAATGMDVLTHAIEAYVSNASSPLTDLHALESIRLVKSNLVNAVRLGKELSFRNNMMLASLFAGLAFSNASLGLVHAMAHSLGGYADLPHGECNAILLEYVIDFNFESSNKRYEQIGRVFGIDFSGMSSDSKKEALISEIRDLRIKAGIDNSLGALGIKLEQLPSLSYNALNDPCIVTNPKTVNINDIEAIYERAL